MTTYSLEPTRETLHGHFSRDLPPILTISSGDTVQFRTLDAGWGVAPPPVPGERSVKFEPRREDGYDSGHCLVGPIAVDGARPGMTLEAKIDEVRVGGWGWTVAGGWPSRENDRLSVSDGPETPFLWTLDADAKIGRNQHGHEVNLKPFMGVMGMPTNEAGRLPTAPPRATGGNLDCKELTAGSILYLPIAVDGGLFSVGDGHGRQGDGEICTTAIECPMERVTLTFNLRDDFPITTPHVRTPGSWITLGLHDDLNEATFLAIEAMLDLMQAQYKIGRREALGLASLVVDMRITQIVNGTRGVHAVLPDGAVRFA